MSEELKKTITFLEKKVRVLEDVNSQLTKRAEDSMLLRLVAVKNQDLQDEVEVFENVLEKISVLKRIPYASCGQLTGTQLEPIASYSAFSNQKNIGYPITFSQEFISKLSDRPVIVKERTSLECHFENSSFKPVTVVLIPFKTQTFKKSVFIFMNDETGDDRLSRMVMLLKHVVDMAISKVDNISLFRALTRFNSEQESLIKQRTRIMSHANQILAKEMARRIAMEKALKESHQTFLTVLNSIDATVYVADLDSHDILFMNKHMIDAFGEDFTGKKCFKVFRSETSSCNMCTNKQLLDEDGNPAGVVVWQGKNPVTGNWYVNYDRAIKWTDGRVVRLQIATDITRLKRMESQLHQSQKFEAIGTLSGGIAHDFNNLLMGIQGHASLIGVKLESPHPVGEHIKAIDNYVQSATKLTGQLLGFARGGKYEVIPLDINALLVKTATMFGRTKKEIHVHNKLQNPPPVVAVDQKQIEQVLLNLFINSGQAMPGGGDLFLETKTVNLSDEYCNTHQIKPGQYVMISVKDTGVGMDEATREQIFDPFFTTKEKGRGTGLGLASAYGIIKNHAGLIMVYSEVGQGATFNIYLPVSDQPVYVEKPDQKELLNGKETVLLVDDEEMVIEVGQAMLEKLGYQVSVARSGEEACEIVEDSGKEIDLVILDLIMPGIDGGQTFDRIREVQPNMPVILSSGYSVSGQATEIMSRGCNGFLQKPFDMYKFSQKIRTILDKYDRSALG